MSRESLNHDAGLSRRLRFVRLHHQWICAIAYLAIILGLGAVPRLHADGIETAGTVLQYALPTIAGGTTLALQDYKGTLQFGESFALTEGVTYGLKYSVNETRPNGGGESFPSAHTSVSFCSAEFIRKRYGWRYGIPAYGLASFVAYSRVEARAHWPHDVIAGAGIGILSSYIFTRPYRGWRIQAEGDSKYIGFALNRTW